MLEQMTFDPARAAVWFRVQGSGFRVQGSGFRVQGKGWRRRARATTEGPSWGYSRCVLGAIGAFLEPFVNF
jgi:hypothetical protein